MAGNWNRDPGFGFGSSTADYDLMRKIAKEKEEREGVSVEDPAFLELFTGSSDYYPPPNAHSTIDSLIMRNDVAQAQRPDARNFPGKALMDWLLETMQLSLGSGMPLENPAKYKKP